MQAHRAELGFGVLEFFYDRVVRCFHFGKISAKLTEIAGVDLELRVHPAAGRLQEIDGAGEFLASLVQRRAIHRESRGLANTLFADRLGDLDLLLKPRRSIAEFASELSFLLAQIASKPSLLLTKLASEQCFLLTLLASEQSFLVTQRLSKQSLLLTEPSRQFALKLSLPLTQFASKQSLLLTVSGRLLSQFALKPSLP